MTRATAVLVAIPGLFRARDAWSQGVDTVLEFLKDTYSAAAGLAKCDRAALVGTRRSSATAFEELAAPLCLHHRYAEEALGLNRTSIYLRNA